MREHCRSIGEVITARRRPVAPGAGTTPMCCARLADAAGRPARRILRCLDQAIVIAEPPTPGAGCDGEGVLATDVRPLMRACPHEALVARLRAETLAGTIRALEQLTLKRHAASISGVLAETWPALDRTAAGSLAGIRRSRRPAGTKAWPASILATWLATPACGVSGARHSTPSRRSPGRRDSVGFPKRGSALKLHQLAHRTRRRAAPARSRGREPGAAAWRGAGPDHAPSSRPRWPASTPASGLCRRHVRCSRRSSRPRRGQGLRLGTIDMMVAEAETSRSTATRPTAGSAFAVPLADEPRSNGRARPKCRLSWR